MIQTRLVNHRIVNVSLLNLIKCLSSKSIGYQQHDVFIIDCLYEQCVQPKFMSKDILLWLRPHLPWFYPLRIIVADGIYCLTLYDQSIFVSLPSWWHWQFLFFCLHDWLSKVSSESFCMTTSQIPANLKYFYLGKIYDNNKEYFATYLIYDNKSVRLLCLERASQVEFLWRKDGNLGKKNCTSGKIPVLKGIHRI